MHNSDICRSCFIHSNPHPPERRKGDKAALAWTHARLGKILLERGDLEEAERHLTLSFETYRYPQLRMSALDIYDGLMRSPDMEG